MEKISSISNIDNSQYSTSVKATRPTDSTEKLLFADAGKSESILDWAKDKFFKNKIDKTDPNKKIKKKFLETLNVVSDAVLDKVLDNSVLSSKITRKFVDNSVDPNIDKMFKSQNTKDKINKVLDDEVIQQRLLQILDNKNVDRNVKAIMQNKDVQDAIITVLKDEQFQSTFEKKGLEHNKSKAKLEALKNLSTNESLIKLVMNNKYLQEMISDFLKNPDDGFCLKESKEFLNAKSSIQKSVVKYNTIINTEMNDNIFTTTKESFNTFVTLGAAGGKYIGDISGYYIPYGTEVLGTTGKYTGGFLGGLIASVGNCINEILKLFCDKK